MKNYYFFSTYLFSSIFIFSLQANGIGIIDGGNNIYLQMVDSDIAVQVSNQIAVVTVTQTFKNTTGDSTNFRFGFPLNENANPIDLRWNVYGQWNEAAVSAGQQNNDIPGVTRPIGNNPSRPNQLLTDYLGNSPLLFSPKQKLANDSLITFELTYVELLPYYLGKVNFFLKGDHFALDSTIVDQQNFSFTVVSDRNVINAAIQNLNGEVRLQGNQADIIFESFETPAIFDYGVEYELSSQGLGVNALTTFIPDSLFNCDSLGNGYATFIIEPESNVDTEVIEKNFTLIIDRSGSMSGNKITQAKDAAAFIIQNLNIGDFFNLIDFSSNIKSVFSSHVAYNLSNQNYALNYIDGISAGGSTNISGALSTSIDQFNVVDPDKANIIIFFTDGQATVGITDTPGILEEVTRKVTTNETSIFLFTFGVGESVDQSLLTLLARQNNGLVNFIEPQNLESDLTRFFLSINNPVLINTQISFEPDIISEAYPFPYPNLYKGQQLILTGRYQAPQPVRLRIEGQAFNIPVSYDFSLNLADTTIIENSVLPKIWAKQKLDALQLDNILVSTNEESTFIQSLIDSISVCYGVVDLDFTSFEDNTLTKVEEFDLPKSTITIKVFPTVFGDFFELKISQDGTITNEPLFLELLDINGRQIRQETHRLYQSESIIRVKNLEHLSPGLYFCRIQIQDQSRTLRIIKA